MPTSSMSKTMTAYMTFEALKEGRLKLDDKFTVSEKAWRKQGSKMFLEVGSQVSIDDLLKGLLIQSGNDAAITLGEGLGGTEDAFAAAITEKAHQLGMKNTHFANASGWPDPEHYSTAHDLTILVRDLIKNFPDYYKRYCSQEEFTYNNIRQRNRNPLLYRNIGADGVKTGHTEVGGYGLIGSGVYNGRRVIEVLNGMPSEKDRAQEGARLLEWALRSFENVTLFKAGDIITNIDVVLGDKEQVGLTIDQDAFVTVPSLNKSLLKVEAEYKAPLMAPIKKGDVLGELRIKITEDNVVKIPLVAAEDVKEQGFIQKTFSKMMLKLGGGKKS